MVRAQMNDKEHAWYDSLTERDHEELRNAYIDKIISKNIPTSYESFVLLCSNVAVMSNKKQQRVSYALERKLKKEGLR